MNQDIENIKEQLEEVIKKNLPEKINNEHADKDAKKAENPRIAEMLGRQAGFNQAISQIPISLIADEVLKVVVEKIKEEIKNNVAYGNFGFSRMDFKHEGQIAINMNDILQLLSNLSPNKENE